MTENNPSLPPVELKQSPADYARFGVSPDKVAPWEDGLRVDPATKEYEWWYFDASFEDGAKLVIVFQTKPYEAPTEDAQPLVKFTYTRRSGDSIDKIIHCDPAEFSAAKDICDVRFGKNCFQGDLETYSIHVEFDDVVCDVACKRGVSSWRPGTGMHYFGDSYYGWVIPVPGGEVQATITQGGKTEKLKGNAYHDHNWGDAPMASLIHHWYWGRGGVGDYVFVLGEVMSEVKFGYAKLMDFMLARNGKIVADDGTCTELIENALRTDPETGKPYGQTLVFEHRKEGAHYRITLASKAVINRQRFHDANDGAYMRFTGDARIEHIEGGKVVDMQNGPAIWEMMYFGKPLKK